MRLFGEVFESSKAMSDSHSRHASMDGNGDNVGPHMRKPLQTGLHVLTKEGSDTLCVDNVQCTCMFVSFVTIQIHVIT